MSASISPAIRRALPDSVSGVFAACFRYSIAIGRSPGMRAYRVRRGCSIRPQGAVQRGGGDSAFRPRCGITIPGKGPVMTLEAINPATGETIATYDEATPQQV